MVRVNSILMPPSSNNVSLHQLSKDFIGQTSLPFRYQLQGHSTPVFLAKRLQMKGSHSPACFKSFTTKTQNLGNPFFTRSERFCAPQSVVPKGEKKKKPKKQLSVKSTLPILWVTQRISSKSKINNESKQCTL